MKVVILAGGQGKRLMPLTIDRPKPLVEVAGRPIIDRQIERFKAFGATSFVILASHMKEKIVEHLGDGSRFGTEVEFCFDDGAFGTAGALKNAESLLSGEGSFFMANGDVITDIDIKKLSLDGAVASIALAPLRSPFGILDSADGKVTDFREKPVLSEYWMNAGMYAMSEEVFSHLPERGDLEKAVFPELARKGLLNCTKYESAYWISVDSIKDLEQAAKDIGSGRIL